ncbi:glycosyltransferase family 2 protein [Bacteriovorax stolpii]|uniref:glycosyltransferase family 2 protein n=1 Tax=Bacteriovorax stolpii TaxID=960 RepID=UPI00115998A2|nr:glycosyltransferase family 2 protein [Bacteriovorax stolpii]QDK43127.1 glycosyltransferase family 2 protein [Bacteriovorax stolpii]
MNKLTVAIITYNEENNIERCITSVKEIADEVLVVDSFSTDKTEEIATRLGARFVKNPFAGHIEQKNFALDLSTHDYVLSLDADEALSPELLAQIKIVKKNFNMNGYRFNRLTNYNGHWVRHCGWYPDTKLRLIKKGKARWGGENPHDILQMTVNEGTGFLNGDLLHYSYDSITAHVTQTNKFTTIAAHAAFKQGKRSSVFKIVTRPVFKFFRDYFIKGGFLDGRYGFIICCINSLYALLKYSKLHELQLGKKI